MRRIAGLVTAAIGVVTLLVGIIFVITAKSGDVVSATANTDGSAVVYTTSGVLDLVEPTVSVEATGAKDATITVAFGSPEDVEGWASGLNATKVTGLKDWETLATEKAEGEATEAVLADSDMWVNVEQAKGTFAEDYEVSSPGTIALIATSSDGKAPRLDLSWKSQSGSPSMPIMLIGLLITLIGAVLIFIEKQKDATDAERREIRARKRARRAERSQAETTVLSLEEIVGSSREKQAAVTGGALGAGILAASTRAQELRQRELSQADRLVIPEPEPEPDDADDQQADAGVSVSGDSAVTDTVTADAATVSDAATSDGEETTADGASAADGSGVVEPGDASPQTGNAKEGTAQDSSSDWHLRWGFVENKGEEN